MTARQFPQALVVRQKAFSIDELGLQDAGGRGSLQYITRLARRVLSAPMSLIGIFEDGTDRQLLVSGLGMPDDWGAAGWIPLSKSFSQFVRRESKTLAVDDKDAHPMSGALEDRDHLPYRSYLGSPIYAPSGEALGSLCVVDDDVRHWTDEDIAVLEDLAQCVTDAILLRAALLTSQQLQEDLERSLSSIRRNIALRDTIVAAFTAPDRTAEERLQALLKAGCQTLNMDAAAVTRVDGPRGRVLAQYRADGKAPNSEDWNISNTLTAQLLTGQELLGFSDADIAGQAGKRAFDGSEPGCFIGAPLVLDGVAYGALEFIGASRNHRDEFEMESSVVSVIAMFAITQLEIFSQIDRLKRSENALLQYILDLRASQKPS